MTFTAEQKSQLAKLLATENLTVQHQKIRTAKFDPTNRVLYLPIWQNMSGAIYDLLVGHETGHALYTPAEGWHDAIVKNAKGRYYKNFLNVVEDARIEKKVQRKYPGLKKQFIAAYAELINRDFFGTKNREVNELSFIDRLNIFSKSQWANTNIRFSAKEKDLVDQVRAVETWDDVVRVTGAVFDYSKEEQKEMQLEQFEEMMMNGYGDEEESDEYEDYDSTDFGEEFSDESVDDFGDDSGDTNEGEGSNGDNGVQSKTNLDEDGEDEVEDDSLQSQFNRFKDSKESWEDQFDPKCETDQQFRRNEDALLDEKCKDVFYISVPKPILKNIITPAKRVHELHDKYVNHFVANSWLQPGLATQLLQQFKNRNDRYIGLLAKEFEMRKAARSYSKAKVSDTGDIDINKLATYKFDDNIFRKIMSVPKGKSHGLILLLDKSGSMSHNMSGSIEQILVLTMFCRKVNIPFVVYGFGGSASVRLIDIGLNRFEDNEYSFTRNEGELQLANVFLREYLNSKMSNAEFTKATKHMLLIKESFEYNEKNPYNRNRCPRFDTEDLSNTPLSEALIATAEIMNDFKQKNNLDITNLVIVHDGDADYNRCYWKPRVNFKGQTYMAGTYFDNKNVNYFLSDTKNKFVKKLSSDHDAVFNGVIDWFSKVTNSKVFGFFICESARGAAKSAIENRFYVNDISLATMRVTNWLSYKDILTKKLKELRSEKFLESKVPGYGSFFLIAGGNQLETDEEEIEVKGKHTTKSLVKAFTEFNKKKAVNRVLVSKFIQGIAA
jgi:hypothetical protein